MKVYITLDISIEGKLDKSRIEDIILEKNGIPGMILSEDVDGTDDWAIIIDSVELSMKPRSRGSP